MACDAFGKIWDELLKEKDLNEFIKSHLCERKAFLEAVRKYAERSKHNGSAKVLEIGCGTAIDSYYIAEEAKVDVWAIDISDKAVEIAKKIGNYFNSKISIMVSDITNISFKEGSFDLVFSQGVVEHFKDPLKVIIEQSRLLRKGGYLIVDVPQKYNIYSLYRKILAAMDSWPYGWERGYSVFELRRLGHLAGLQEVEFFGRGVTSELSRSKRFCVRTFGRIYNFAMRCFYRVFYRFGALFLQDITSVFKKI
jgi:SAM-dependent methyltransferase